ncbi:nuclear transport factor 2 family protein [Nocardia sp. NPDC055321]
MITNDSPAVRVALDYFHAWTGKDMDTAMKYVAEDIACDAPAGRIEGAAAYRAFLEPFSQMLVGATMFAAFGNDTTALVMYNTSTLPVANGPGAELVTIVDGRITQSRFIFDRVPFEAARSAAH